MKRLNTIIFCALLLTITPIIYAAPPTIDTDLTDQAVDEDNSLSITLTVSDDATASANLQLSATSSNSALIPASGISITVNGSSRTLRLTPTANANGSTTITLTLTDGDNETTQDSFAVSVNAVNDAPTISSIGNQTSDEDTAHTVSFTISDVDNDTLQLSVAAADTTLFPAGSLVFGGSDSGRTLVLTPAANLNGSSSIGISVSDGTASTTESFNMTINPVNDAPTISGTPTTPVNDNAVDQTILSGITIADVDQDQPNNETLTVTVSLDNNDAATLVQPNDIESNQITGTPSTVTSNLRSWLFNAVANRQAVGTSETVNITITVRDAAGASSSAANSVVINSVNDDPTLSVQVNPATISDSIRVNPFEVDIGDADIGETFTLSITQANVLGRFEPDPATFTGTAEEIENAVLGLNYIPSNLSAETLVTFNVVLRDSQTGQTSQSPQMTVQGVNDTPNIVGVAQEIIRIFDNGTAQPFASVRVDDPDDAGQQAVTVTVTASDSTLGTLQPAGPFSGTPSAVTSELQSMLFTPNPMADGQTARVTFTISVRDDLGATRTNNATQLLITGVNDAPVLSNIPQTQPASIDSAHPFPFANLGITDDDSTTLSVEVSLDDAAKGVLSGTAFSESVPGSGTYRLANVAPSAAQSELRNLQFSVSDSYAFPPGEPGATTFTIRLSDTQNITTHSYSIVLADNDSRSHLVTSISDSSTAGSGSLRRALALADSGDIIVFALAEYPAIIQLDSELVIDKNLSFKGPGADLLMLRGSGSSRIMTVDARVELEGLTLSNGVATTGGAIAVGANGQLTMRYCAITDSQADQWGGAIDVDQGSLQIEHCLFRGNTVSAALGLGGGAIALHSNQASSITNTTFSANQQLSSSGFGGGALYLENYTPSTTLTVTLQHLTFAENIDAADNASAVLANVFGTEVDVAYSIFADATERALGVLGAASILSGGGNIADDSTRVTLMQNGVPQEIFLLDQASDLTQTDALLEPLQTTLGPTSGYPLAATSPAVDHAVNSTQALDQRGVLRGASADAGALESGVNTRLILNEFLTYGSSGNFIELYVPPNSSTVDLSAYTLWIDSNEQYRFTESIAPGRGLIVSLDLAERGRIAIRNATGQNILITTYIDAFVDPTSTINPPQSLLTNNNSLTLAPQFNGAAYLPHSIVQAPPLGGADLAALNISSAQNSPDADSTGAPFDGSNALPIAIADRLLTDEDELIIAAITENDFDAEGDALSITDISAESGPGIDNPSAESPAGAALGRDANDSRQLRYDPRQAETLQALPAGAKLLDSFFYEINDAVNTALEQRSEAEITVAVLGANDAPVAHDDSLTSGEETIIRIMADPDLLGAPPDSGFDSDDDYPQVPQIVTTLSLLSNDSDVDDDDHPPNQAGNTPTLTLVGIVQKVNAINGYSGTVGSTPVTVNAAAHGLEEGATILIAGYRGHRSYNGIHTISVVDADSFTLPIAYVDNDNSAGNWAAFELGARLATTSLHGAEVTLELRTDRIETNIVYNPLPSEFLDGLALNATADDEFFYAVQDSHGALDLGKVTITVTGVNDAPVSVNDPGALTQLEPLRGDGETLANVLARLELRYPLAAASGNANRTDLEAADTDADPGGTIILLDELFSSVEDQAITLNAADILHNDSDVDRGDILRIVAFAADQTSAKGAALSLDNDGNIIYDPAVSAELNDLAREQTVLDSFELNVTDDQGATVTSQVALLITGVNDRPETSPDSAQIAEDQVLTIEPPGVLANDVDDNVNPPANQLTLLAETKQTAGPALADVVLGSAGVRYDPTVSAYLDGLAVGQSYLDSVDYTAIDWSLVFAHDDYFQVAADGSDYVLEVLNNDRDLNDNSENLQLIDVLAPNRGGTAVIEQATDGSQYIVYTPPVNFVGDEAIRYQVTNGLGNNDHGFVNVQVVVENVNGRLIANADAFSVAKGESASLDVLLNDDRIVETPTSTALQIIRLGSDASTLSTDALLVLANGDEVELIDDQLTYRQKSNDANAFTQTFSYEISAGGTARAMAQVTVVTEDRTDTLNVNDDAFSVLQDSADNLLAVLDNDAILPGGAGLLTVNAITAAPSNGTLSIDSGGNGLVYTPTAGFSGADTFAYRAGDGFGASGAASVTVNVVSLTETITRSEPPVGESAANPDLFSVALDSNANVLDVLTNDAAAEERGQLTIVALGSAFGSALGSGPEHGGIITLNNAADAVLYTPAAGFSGEETFTYTWRNTLGQTDTARVVVRVAPALLNANDDAFSAFLPVSGSTLTFTLPVLDNDSILPDLGELITITGVGIDDINAENAPDVPGLVAISADASALQYTPQDTVNNYQESFTYEISDGSERRAEATVTITVQQRDNTLAMVTHDDAFSVAADSNGNVLTVLANDNIKPADAASWIISAVSTPSFGVALNSGSTISYTPNSGFVGSDTFSYTVSDGFGATGSAEVTVKVGDLVLTQDRFVALSGSSDNVFDVIANDNIRPAAATSLSGPDPVSGDDNLRLSVTTLSQGGSANVIDNAAGIPVVLYTPDPNYNGHYPYTESLTYSVQDDSGASTTSQALVDVFEIGSDRASDVLSVTVNGVNDAPQISGTAANPGAADPAPVSPIQLEDRETVMPFPHVLISEIDDQGNELLGVTVTITPDHGDLTNIGEFTADSLAGFTTDANEPGVYRLNDVTAAQATSALNGLIYDPIEDRIIGHPLEVNTLTIAVSDPHIQISDDSTQIEVPGGRLISYWNLNEAEDSEIAADSAGYVEPSLDAEVFGNIRFAETRSGTSAPAENAATAVYFPFSNKNDNRIARQHSDAFELDNGTLLMWFNLDQANVPNQNRRNRNRNDDDDDDDDNRNRNSNNKKYTLFAKDRTGNRQGHLYIQLHRGSFEVRLQNWSVNHFLRTDANEVVVTPNQWHHLAFSFGAEGMKLYFDGQLVAADENVTFGLNNNKEVLVIGASNATNSADTRGRNFRLERLQTKEAFQGLIDEVAIFDIELSPSQIARFMQRGIIVRASD